MDLDSIPIVLKNIILSYKEQLDITEKYNKCVSEINEIKHYIWDDIDEEITNNVSLREYTSYSLHQMYPGFVLGIINCKTGFDVIL